MEKSDWYLLAGVTLFTQYLFYLDEGYFDFRWMENPGNWLMCFFYTGLFYIMGYGIKSLIRLVKNYLIGRKSY